MGARLPGVLLLMAAACGDTGGDTAAPGDCDRDPPLSYDNFGQQFMDTHCAGCHSSLLPEPLRNGAPLGVDLDTYAGVVQWVDRIEARSVGDDADMPPGGGPSDEERARLAEWLRCAVRPDHDALQEPP
ncbi:MAG: hypothetical protein D6798_05435 [Deltaproteobacteria bacterium]|nr:MAG: hypothetical protein D6798_05435 [Deltaproteobacteria bacterium]